MMKERRDHNKNGNQSVDRVKELELELDRVRESTYKTQQINKHKEKDGKDRIKCHGCGSIKHGETLKVERVTVALNNIEKVYNLVTALLIVK